METLMDFRTFYGGVLKSVDLRTGGFEDYG
jgi:hypothetical protein